MAQKGKTSLERASEALAVAASEIARALDEITNKDRCPYIDYTGGAMLERCKLTADHQGRHEYPSGVRPIHEEDENK